MEKYNEFAGIVSEVEIDDMMGDNEVAGGTTSLPCFITAAKFVEKIIDVTCSFENCPTTVCTNRCRL